MGGEVKEKEGRRMMGRKKENDKNEGEEKKKELTVCYKVSAVLT